MDFTSRQVPVLLFSAICGLLFSHAPLFGDASQDRQAQRNGGYFLLYHISADEKQLGLLLMVKTTTPEIGDYIKRVTKVAGDSVDALDEMRDADPRIQFDPDPLPQIELDVRASIKEGKQHQLLFGTTGAMFNRALLVSQLEATNYASNLAKVIGEQETNPHRAKVLAKLSERWAKLRDEGYRLLGD